MPTARDPLSSLELYRTTSRRRAKLTTSRSATREVCPQQRTHYPVWRCGRLLWNGPWHRSCIALSPPKTTWQASLVLWVGKGSNILKVPGPTRVSVVHRCAMRGLVDKSDEIHRLGCCVVARDDDVAIVTEGEDGGLSHLLRIRGAAAFNLAR